MKKINIIWLLMLAVIFSPTAMGQNINMNGWSDTKTILSNGTAPYWMDDINAKMEPVNRNELNVEYGIMKNQYSKADEDIKGGTRGSRAGRGFASGALIGATAGGLIGFASWTECTEVGFMACFMHPDSRGGAFIWGAVIGAPVGGLIGLIAGAASEPKSEQKARKATFSVGHQPTNAYRDQYNPSFKVKIRF